MTSPSRLRIIADAGAIGCGLTADEMGDRIDEWHRLAAAADTREPIDDGVRMTFDTVDRRALADLVEREHECCPFLSFATVLSPGGTTLEIRAPAGAGELLAALF